MVDRKVMVQDSQESVPEFEVIETSSREAIYGLMVSWLERLEKAQIGHYSQSEKLYSIANCTGYALIVSSTIVTAMLFMDAKDGWKHLLIFMSILSAALSGVVSFARFSEKAEQHRSAAGCYGKLRRQLEKLDATKSRLSDIELDKQLKILRIEWEYTSQSAPLTPYSSIKNAEKIDHGYRKK
ncbi:TPA: SLATT domain-containing protein [Vibrio parahaemolyticus]|nr:SLATT domain-containing protein [Vibrio parahaemolyticus]